MRRAAATLALAASLAGCLSPAIRREREAWRQDWNARASAAKSDWENPCATRVFIAWADPLLERCPYEVSSEECEARRDWVDERVEQCRAWTAWMLRNFNQHERTEGIAPSVSIDWSSPRRSRSPRRTRARRARRIPTRGWCRSRATPTSTPRPCS